jgi:CheY-like chemotaxis protein
VRSVVGRGSQFSVQVPLSPAQALPQAPRGILRLHPGQLTGTVVLCIDNEPAVLDGMEALLTSWGCHVLKASDLDTAIAAVRLSPQPPNGLLVDYHLDQGNGIDAVAALRHSFGADLPAILITADRSPAVRQAARRANIQLLNKPLKPAALRALLAQLRVQRAAAAE